MPPLYTYEYFNVSFPAEYVAHVEIDRADKMNAFKEIMWLNLYKIFKQLDRDPEVRCVMLSGKGERAFTAGLDVQAASEGSILGPGDGKSDPARRAHAIRDHMTEFQECITAIERCKKPVIVVMHGYTFGLGIDIAAAADIRIAAANTQFSVKEVDIGIAADIGTLTRLPLSGVPLTWVKDVCLTARTFPASEALAVGFLSSVHETRAAAVEKGLEKARSIASKSPVATTGTKHLIDWSVGRARGGIVDAGLGYTAAWNAAMVQTQDVQSALLSGLKKQKPVFAKL